MKTERTLEEFQTFIENVFGDMTLNDIIDNNWREYIRDNEDGNFQFVFSVSHIEPKTIEDKNDTV